MFRDDLEQDSGIKVNTNSAMSRRLPGLGICRPDRLFSDPLAARLAGEQGEAIAAMAPRHMRSGWPMIIRTRKAEQFQANPGTAFGFAGMISTS